MMISNAEFLHNSKVQRSRIYLLVGLLAGIVVITKADQQLDVAQRLKESNIQSEHATIQEVFQEQAASFILLQPLSNMASTCRRTTSNLSSLKYQAPFDDRLDKFAKEGRSNLIGELVYYSQALLNLYSQDIYYYPQQFKQTVEQICYFRYVSKPYLLNYCPNDSFSLVLQSFFSESRLFSLILLQTQYQHMELVVKNHPDPDLFMSECVSQFHPNESEIKQAAIQANRYSTQARQLQEASYEEIWALEEEIPQRRSLQQAMQNQYGLQGVLLKQSSGILGSWSQRYVTIKDQRLVYKKDSSAVSKTAGILNFNLLSCEVAIELSGGQCLNFRILVLNSNRQFVFKGSTQQQTLKWLSVVNLALQRSAGWRKNYSYLARYPRLWKKDYQSQAEFKKNVESGDILLFRGSKRSAVMQRAVTGHEFDHIAVVVMNQMGEPLIFEANAGLGVGLCSWKKFMSRKWWTHYDMIVHRKLQVLRTPAFLQRLLKFVETNMGKAYNFSLGDYLFERNSVPEKEHQVYFCSSLVAKLYKQIELLPPQKSCKQYLPSSFAEKEGMQLKIDGCYGYAYLQSQKIVVFEQQKKQ